MTAEVLTPAEVRVSAEHLRAVLAAIDAGTLVASGRLNAFVAGAVCVLEAIAGDRPDMQANGSVLA